jgi:hypothetical protein
MRIKYAYNTLLSFESRRKYDSGNRRSDYSYSGSQRSQSRKHKIFFFISKIVYIKNL